VNATSAPGKNICRRNYAWPPAARWNKPIVFLRERYIAEFSRRFQVAAAERGSAFVPCRRRDLEQVFSPQFERTVNRDNTIGFQNLTL
jgi:hypothetical protein